MRRLLFLFTLLSVAPAAHAQVTVAPTFIYVDARQPVATFNIINRSDTPQEVTTAFRFGYNASDTLGNWGVVFDEGELAEEHDAARWIKAFPPRFVLPPNGRQVVRMIVRAPADLEDGVYWTRLIVHSKDLVSLEERLARQGVEVAYAFNQLFPVIFQKGLTPTGLEVERTSAVVQDGNVALLVGLRRTGDAPHLGSLHLRVYDVEGRVVREKKLPTAVYFDFTSRITFDEPFAPGRYVARLVVTSNHADIPPGQAPALSPVRLEIPFEVAPEGKAEPENDPLSEADARPLAASDTLADTVAVAPEEPPAETAAVAPPDSTALVPADTLHAAADTRAAAPQAEPVAPDTLSAGEAATTALENPEKAPEPETAPAVLSPTEDTNESPRPATEPSTDAGDTGPLSSAMPADTLIFEVPFRIAPAPAAAPATATEPLARPEGFE